MNISLSELFEMTRDEQKQWLESDEHRDDCAAWNEGQLCCIEMLLGFDKEEA